MCAMRIIEEYMYTMAEVCLDLFERNKRDENSIDTNVLTEFPCNMFQ